MVLFLMSPYEIEVRRVVRNMFAHDINRTHDYSTDEKYPIEMLDIYISMWGNMRKGNKEKVVMKSSSYSGT